MITGGVGALSADSANLAGGGFVAGARLPPITTASASAETANFVRARSRGQRRHAAFDLGASTRRFGLQFGASAQNLGRDYTSNGVRQLLPRRFSVGATLPTTSISTYFDFSATAAVSRERDGTVVPRGGVELSFEPVSGWTFSARAGAKRVVTTTGELRQAAIGVGGTLQVDRLALDYAFAPAVAGGPPTHTLSRRIE